MANATLWNRNFNITYWFFHWEYIMCRLLIQSGTSNIYPQIRGNSSWPGGVGGVEGTYWFTSRSSVLIYMYIYICMYIPYTSSVIGRIYNGSVIQYWRSCTPSRSIGECAVPGLNATFCFLWFTNCVLLFDINLILGCLWLLVFVLNNILILGIWCSTIPHFPGCFCPWTFFENIGFNMVLTDPFMSHLTTQLGYSAAEFQALQLIVLAAFGVVD